MANKEVLLLYNEYRLRALETALTENDSSIELALKTHWILSTENSFRHGSEQKSNR